MAHGFPPWVIKFFGHLLGFSNDAVVRRSVIGVPFPNHTGSNLRRACGKVAGRRKGPGKPEIAPPKSLYLRFRYSYGNAASTIINHDTTSWKAMIRTTAIPIRPM
jgi:hypothetical protein